MKKIIILIFLSIFQIQICSAIVSEYEATPSIISESGAIILLTEINFKNSEKDYAVITYKSPANKPINLKGIQFADDTKFKKIQNDFIVASGQQIVFTLESAEADSPPYIYSTKKGLTGTTEQLIIYDQNNEILDMVCWASSSPTTSEIADMQEAFESEGWISPDPKSCIPSEKIPTNQSIKRISLNDTNSIADWQLPVVTTEKSSETTASMDNSSTDNPNIDESTSNIDPALTDPGIKTVNIPSNTIAETSKETKTSTQKKSSSKSTSYKNGSLSDEIKINEILPNPDKTDTGNEWIELINTGTKKVNLGNWTLDDNEDGSKPYLIPDTTVIEPGGLLLLTSKVTKLSLGNSGDSVRLFNYNNELIDEIDFEEAPSGKSLSVVTINNQDDERSDTELIWTTEITPGEPNPVYEKFKAEITAEPSFETDYFFEVKNAANEVRQIYFAENTVAAPLAKASFIPGTEIDLVTKNDGEKLTLKEYQITGTKAVNNENSSILIYIIAGFIAGGVLLIIILYKKIPWQKKKNQI